MAGVSVPSVPCKICGYTPAKGDLMRHQTTRSKQNNIVFYSVCKSCSISGRVIPDGTLGEEE